MTFAASGDDDPDYRQAQQTKGKCIKDQHASAAAETNGSRWLTKVAGQDEQRRRDQTSARGVYHRAALRADPLARHLLQQGEKGSERPPHRPQTRATRLRLSQSNIADNVRDG
jgi:hypothetical protein